MRKPVVLTALLIVVTPAMAAFPAISDAFFLIWTPDGGFVHHFGGGYGHSGYGGWYGGYGCDGWYWPAVSYGCGY